MFNWREIHDNVWNPVFYRTLISEPLSAGFKYYLKLSLWLALLYTIFVSVFFLPNLVRLSRGAVNDFSAAYPAELKIHLQNGKASVNQPEPVVIPLPAAQRRIFALNPNQAGTPLVNLAVIDTRTPLALEEFNSHHSLFVLKMDAAAGAAGTVARVTKIPADSNVIIDKNIVMAVAKKVQTGILFLTPLLVPVAFLLILFFLLLTILPLLVVSLAAWALLLVADRNPDGFQPRLGQTVNITLHAATLALIVNFFIFVLYPSFSFNFPFLITITLLVVYFNLIQQQKVVLVKPAAPAIIPADTITEPEGSEVEAKKEETPIEPEAPKREGEEDKTN